MQSAYTVAQIRYETWNVIQPDGRPLYDREGNAPIAFKCADAAHDCAERMNNPRIDPKSIELEDVDPRDFPDFCDAYISYAETMDGEPLNDFQLEKLNEDGEFINELSHESFH